MFVSVVMPIYNGQRFVREAIDSVLAQSHRDFELLAIDDGSSDRSPAILAELAAADRRIRLITQANGGGARARNRALQEARAEWIINLDHDDVMLPHRIERQLAFIAGHPGVKVFSCRAYYMSDDGRIFGTTRCEPITTRAAFERHVAANRPIGINHPAAAMHRPTILEVGGYRPEFEGAEDLDLWNRVAERGHLVLQQDEVLMKYRIHGTSVMASRTRQSWQQGEWAIACMEARRAGRPEPTGDAYQADLRAQPWWRRLRRHRHLLARVHYRVAGFDIANRRWSSALCRLLIAALSSPSYVAVRLANQLHLPGQTSGGRSEPSMPPPPTGADGELGRDVLGKAQGEDGAGRIGGAGGREDRAAGDLEVSHALDPASPIDDGSPRIVRPAARTQAIKADAGAAEFPGHDLLRPA